VSDYVYMIHRTDYDGCTKAKNDRDFEIEQWKVWRLENKDMFEVMAEMTPFERCKAALRFKEENKSCECCGAGAPEDRRKVYIVCVEGFYGFGSQREVKSAIIAVCLDKEHAKILIDLHPEKYRDKYYIVESVLFEGTFDEPVEKT
jgi:hypothetical protein